MLIEQKFKTLTMLIELRLAKHHSIKLEVQKNDLKMQIYNCMSITLLLIIYQFYYLLYDFRKFALARDHCFKSSKLKSNCTLHIFIHHIYLTSLKCYCHHCQRSLNTFSLVKHFARLGDQ